MRAVGDLILEQRKHADEEPPQEPKPQGGNVPPARTPLRGDETVRITQDNQPRLAAVRDIAATKPGGGMMGGVMLKAGGRSRQLAQEAAEQAEALVAPFTAHLTDSANPHSVTKAQVGLGSAADLAPADYPVSTAQAAADAAVLAAAIQRANHTGAQAISTVTGLQTALDAKTAIVADRTALAALSAATTVAFLKEAGREGIFEWDGSDLSAQVTADTQQGIYVPPTAGNGSTGAWVRVHDGQLNVKWFGAVGDWVYATLTGTDNANAFTSMFAILSDGETMFVPPGKYRIASAHTITDKNFVMVGGDPMSTQLIFHDCNAFHIDQSGSRYQTVTIEGIAFVTTAEKIHTGLKYTGATNTGDVPIRPIRNCIFIGNDRIELDADAAGEYLQAWLYGCELEQGDRFTFENTWFQGAEQDRVVGVDFFPVANIAVKANNTSHLKLLNSPITIWELGVRCTGLGEGMEVRGGNIVACNRAVDVSANDLANGHVFNDCHMSSYAYNINYDGGTTTPVEQFIHNCNFFKRGDSITPNFKHLILKCNGPIITGNWFFFGDGAASVASGDVAILCKADTKKANISNNMFYQQATLVQYEAGADRNMFINNQTIDDATSVLAAPIIDAGAANMQWGNDGDRHLLFPAFQRATNSNGDFNAASFAFGVGTDRARALLISSIGAGAVNYIEALNSLTGQPARLRAVGSDTNIDIMLTGKGTGRAILALPRSTTAALEAIGNAINTVGKVTEKVVINTTTGAIVTAASGAAGGVWKALDGTTAHTPV